MQITIEGLDSLNYRCEKCAQNCVSDDCSSRYFAAFRNHYTRFCTFEVQGISCLSVSFWTHIQVKGSNSILRVDDVA